MFLERPEGVEDARNHVIKLIEELKVFTKLPLSKFVLCGFSQGSMLATDIALHLPENVGSLIVWSGVLTNLKEWQDLAPQRKVLDISRYFQIFSFGNTDWEGPPSAATPRNNGSHSPSFLWVKIEGFLRRSAIFPRIP